MGAWPIAFAMRRCSSIQLVWYSASAGSGVGETEAELAGAGCLRRQKPAFGFPEERHEIPMERGVGVPDRVGSWEWVPTSMWSIAALERRQGLAGATLVAPRAALSSRSRGAP